MKQNLYLSCLIIFSFSFLPQNLFAQQNNPCDGHIREAREEYKIGDFDKVISRLTPCVEGTNMFSNRSLLEDAIVLLASSYIVKDSINLARDFTDRLIEINPNFQTRSDDLLVFRKMVEEAKRGDLIAKVSSVSKVSENLYEAPATVILITDEEIKRRGYNDLEALLHDLPGFDISRSNGILYSSIYQRGYRSNNTNRMLLMVDGVEENDLWGNIVYLSRQYPIANIKSVEVVYGPASTIYGANAYVGVISINTKNPVEMVDKDKLIGLTGEIGYGSWNTRYADATMAISFPNNPVSISLTSRIFQSNEPRWPNDPYVDFGERELTDPFVSGVSSISNVQDLFEYRLNISDNSTAHTFYQTYMNHANSDYFQLNVENGDSTISVSDIGLARARDIENELWRTAEYSDKTNAYAFAAKMQFGNLLLGWQYWAKEEGVGVWFNDVRQGGTNEGQYWSPFSNFFFARYDTRISNVLNFTSFTRYKVHGYLESNKLVTTNAYSNGRMSLDQLLDEEAISFGSPFALTTRSNQMRNENRLIYTPNSNFSLVSGFELRYSAIQDNYATVSTDGTSSAQDHFFFADVGVYTQARYQKDELTFTGGLRYDFNTILDTVGFGTSGTGYGSQVNPRIAIVYHPGDYVFKAIFATAFKDATNFDRYSTVSGQRDLPNPSLRPERAFNYEVSARRFLDTDRRSSIELVGYFADYTSVIGTKTVAYNTGTTTQFQNSGLREVYGVQGWADYRMVREYGDFYFYGNYTYTHPTDHAPAGEVLQDANGDDLTDENGNTVAEARVGDIARHQVNFGANWLYDKRLNVNLRGNFMGSRQTGPGTTVTGNRFTFDPYLVMFAAVSYSFPEYGLTVQGVLNNIFNTTYYSPGLRDADNFRFTSALPQNPINFHLKVKWDFSVVNIDRSNASF